jgi:hypothetical protein
MNVSPSEVLSFRHILVEELRAFLRAEHIGLEDAAEGLGEALVMLSRYREEGSPLYPALFITADLGTLLDRLGGLEHLQVGIGPRSRETVKRALKQCAPLGRNGWSIYLERKDSGLAFGLFRCDSFLLAEPPMTRLRSLRDPSARILGMVQLADNVLELRASGGSRRLIYLSGASTEGLATESLFSRVARTITRDLEEPLVRPFHVFLERILTDAMRAPHGTLLAIVPRGSDPRVLFPDAIVLERPVSIAELVRAALARDTPEARSALEGAGQLLSGMLATDGITVVSSAGEILGYNAFLPFGTDERTRAAALGGARRRTFDALAARVGRELVGAFVRSQDGFADAVG